MYSLILYFKSSWVPLVENHCFKSRKSKFVVHFETDTTENVSVTNQDEASSFGEAFVLAYKKSLICESINIVCKSLFSHI